MRFLPSFLTLALTLAGGLLRAQNPDPIVATATIPDRSILATVGTPAINLQSYFAIPSITHQVVQFSTTGKGVFNVEMNTTLAPNTVANFLAYVNANSYTNSIIHRLDKSLGVFQGGGYLNNPSLSAIPTNAPINLETGDTLQNSRGTIAMARGASPNTATSEWFINYADNSLNLPAASAGGYAAFGRVTGTGMTVVDAIAALPVPSGTLTVVSSSTSSNFVTVDGTTLPANFGPGWGLFGSTVQAIIGNFVTLSANATQNINSPTPVTWNRVGHPFDQLPVLAPLPADNALALANLVTESSVRTVPIFPATPGGPSVVTFSAASSNPALVNATVSGSNLFVSAVANLTGSATVTVTATDTNGNSTQSQFNVAVTRRVADFNFDGVPDLLLQNNSGQMVIWYLNNSGVSAGANYFYAAGLGDWKIAVLADWNHDGNIDIIFQNTVGQIVVWYTNGTGGVTGSALIYGSGLGDWRVVAVADWNRDGNPDLILQNGAGQIVVWFTNAGGAVTGAAYIYGAGLGDWKVAAIADMNFDGNPDVILQNNAGQLVAWLTDVTGAVTSAAYLYGGGLGDWRLKRITDVNGDGIDDLIFQNNVGQIVVWYRNSSGAVVAAGYIYGSGLGDWRVH